MTSELFGGRFAPITSEIGFIEADHRLVADTFQAWAQEIQAKRGVELTRVIIDGDFQSAIEQLLPLTSVERRRFLFGPTNSRWSYFLDNGWRGTDAASAVSTLCVKLKCRGVRSVFVPNTIRKSPVGELGRYGANILEVYAADSGQCHFLNTLRSISVANDGGRWRFDSGGAPLDFERVESYESKNIKDRFTFEMHKQYLTALAIDGFDPAYFRANDSSILIAKHGPAAAALKEYTLEEIQSTF